MKYETCVPALDLPTVDVLSRIEGQVQNLLQGRVRDFHLHLHAEGLVLHGWSKTYYVKQLAQHAVMECATLPIRANEIEVQ